MQRRQCPIYNGTLENLIWVKNVVFLSQKGFISLNFYIASDENAKLTFAEKLQMKINSLKKPKHRFLIHT